MRPQPDRAPIAAALITAALCLVLTAIRANPPAPVEPNSNGIFSAVSAQAILEDLYAGDFRHHIGTENNRRLKEQILERLRNLGYEPAVQNTMACWEAGGCGYAENILARLEGTGTGKAVLLAVHYDGVGAGPSISDDGVAVAATLEIARILKEGSKLENDVIFLIDDGEEAFLLGASAFAAKHPWAKDVGAVVNLEARGTGGSSYMFETGTDNAWLIDLMKEAVPRPSTSSVFYSIYQRLPNDTDFTVFKYHGMNGVNFAFIKGVVRYHTPLDNLAHVEPATLQHQGENALGMVRALANADLVTPPSGTASWLDIWGFGILAWPETWNLPLSVVSLLLALFAMGALMRQERLSRGQAVWGCATFPAALLDATILALAATWILTAPGKLPAWPTSSWAPRAMFWLIGIGTSLLVVSILRRKTTGRAIWLGSLVTLSLLALLCSFLLAGAAYLFLLPALVGSLLALLASLWRSRWLPAVSTFLVILAAGAALLPLAWNIWDGMGIPGMPAVTLLIAGFSILVLAPATDSLAKPSNKGALGILALAGAFLILALVLPPYCSESPRALNFYFVQDADTGEARLAARPGSRALPKELAEAVDWDTNKKNLYPWHDGPGVYITAEASALSVEPPQLEILESLETETGRLIRARLQSPRGAARGALVFPDPQRIDSLRLDGWEFDLQTDEVRSWYPDGRRVVRFATMPEQGIDLELTLQGEEPFEVFALDFSFDLPTVGDPLTNGRPPTVVPIDEGDLTIVHTRTEI